MFQWPTADFYKFKKKKIRFSPKKVKEIENFFAKNYKTRFAVLFPSARSSINIILKYNKFDRSMIVNLPLWSSTCLYESIGSITNISVKNYNSECIIAVHKWGNTFNLKKLKRKQLVIDDSADTLPGKNYVPFESNSNYEILSLPKIIGSYSGGIILIKDKGFYNYCKSLQNKNIKLAAEQSEEKYKYNFDKGEYSNWSGKENFNISLDFNTVENIHGCLKNFNININIIKERQKIIKKKFKNIIFETKRLGPCVIFQDKKFKNFDQKLEKKHYNFSKKLFRETYEKCAIFPIHFKITSRQFNKKLNQILKINKKNC